MYRFSSRKQLIRFDVEEYIRDYKYFDEENTFQDKIINNLIENTEVDVIKLFMAHHNIIDVNDIDREFILNNLRYSITNREGFFYIFIHQIQLYKTHLLNLGYNVVDAYKIVVSKFQEFTDFLIETYDIDLEHLSNQRLLEVIINIGQVFMFNEDEE